MAPLRPWTSLDVMRGSRMVLLSDAMQRCAAAECSTFGKQAAPNLANRGSINVYQRG